MQHCLGELPSLGAVLGSTALLRGVVVWVCSKVAGWKSAIVGSFWAQAEEAVVTWGLFSCIKTIIIIIKAYHISRTTQAHL